MDKWTPPPYDEIMKFNAVLAEALRLVGDYQTPFMADLLKRLEMLNAQP